GAQCRRRVTAGEGQQLLRLQPKTVGFLEGRQSRRALDKFGRGGELEAAALGEIGGEIVKAFALGKAAEIAADRDDPGVVCRRRSEPAETVLPRVELLHPGVALRGVLPGRIVVPVKEDPAVAGIFG